MDIRRIQDDVVEEFAAFDDWMDKYSYLIELGNALDNFDEQHRTEQHLIEGCQSRVWLHAQLTDGKVVYTGDSDAIIVKGIVALLIRVLTNQAPQDILDCDLYFIDAIGLKEHLSPTRSNGLVAMVKQMKLYALAFKTQLSGK
ncbi:cysteine desulfuration protein SufE [Breznakibacter xylanolyticus]|uniref:Cysteine desulfuration protein SufE n=1 Tax=Breznakibacter xylanolyticus TaxID=990 RepID=A0A2W7NZC7_9BACT|nr:SufE family protein [Breznakibacter xylanolyticus]MBN2744736.1 SufE family protein [Marinilabiliaceae bacterium]PZX18586.1 cysteine desulfuration protein SufE [Breznakibacter xylanolyticus]